MSACSSFVIQGCFPGVVLLMISQGMIHRIPNTAMPAKVALHPNARYNPAINGAATTEPNEAPAPKMPCAIALSLAGNHSALLFVAPGQFPASLIPSIALKILNEA